MVIRQTPLWEKLYLRPKDGNRHIEVATRHRHRPDERLLGCRDLRVRSLSPGVFARRLEHQLVHLGPFFSDLSSIVE